MYYTKHTILPAPLCTVVNTAAFHQWHAKVWDQSSTGKALEWVVYMEFYFVSQTRCIITMNIS